MKVGFFHLNMIYFILRYRCSTVHNRDVLLCGAYWIGGVCSGDLGDHTSGTDIHSLRPPLQTPPIHYWFWNLLVRHPATTGTDADISTMETVVTYLKNQNKNTIVSTHETAFPLHSERGFIRHSIDQWLIIYIYASKIAVLARKEIALEYFKHDYVSLIFPVGLN